MRREHKKTSFPTVSHIFASFAAEAVFVLDSICEKISGTMSENRGSVSQ